MPTSDSEQMAPDTISPEMIASATAGDAIAMNALLDLLTPPVRRICGPVALDRGADATQEALIAIFRNLHTLREAGALYGWAIRIATREAVRVAKAAASFTTWESFPEIPTHDPGELGVDIEEILIGLSPEHRAILVLRDLEGYSEQEAAALLSIREGTAKSRLHRARSLFRKEWT